MIYLVPGRNRLAGWLLSWRGATPDRAASPQNPRSITTFERHVGCPRRFYRTRLKPTATRKN